MFSLERWEGHKGQFLRGQIPRRAQSAAKASRNERRSTRVFILPHTKGRAGTPHFNHCFPFFSSRSCRATDSAGRISNREYGRAMQETRTVEVSQLSDLATEREVHEFFSFSGEIDRVEIRRDSGQSRIAFVTFKDPKALEIALMLSGATLVDRIVIITAAHNYVPSYGIQEVRMIDNSECVAPPESFSLDAESISGSPGSGRIYVSKAQDVVTSVLAKGTAIRQDAMNKARAFDEKHKLTATASAKVISFDRRVGLTEKLTVGISMVNEKVKSVDQRLQVSDKTMAAILAAERKINNTGSAVKTSRYVTAGTTWLNGAFSKMSKAGQVARTKTSNKFHMAVSNLTAKEPPVVA